LGGGLADSHRLQIGDLAQQQISRLPLDQRDSPAAAVGTHDGVPLPVAVATAAIDDRRASLDAHAGADPPPVFPVRPLPAQTPQITLPVLSRGLLAANPGIDRLVRNLPPPIVREVPPRPAGDLVRRPTLPEAFLHVTPHFRPLHFADPRALTAACLGFLLGCRRPVTVAAAVTPQLAGNGALVAAEPVGNLRLGLSSPVHVGYDLALFQAKMTRHRRDSFRMGLS